MHFLGLKVGTKVLCCNWTEMESLKFNMLVVLHKAESLVQVKCIFKQHRNTENVQKGIKLWQKRKSFEKEAQVVTNSDTDAV